MSIIDKNKLSNNYLAAHLIKYVKRNNFSEPRIFSFEKAATYTSEENKNVAAFGTPYQFIRTNDNKVPKS